MIARLQLIEVWARELNGKFTKFHIHKFRGGKKGFEGSSTTDDGANRDSQFDFQLFAVTKVSG